MLCTLVIFFKSFQKFGYVFETTIPRNVSLAEAPSFGKTILQYSPYSHGAKAYRQLAEEILRLEEGRVS